VATSYRRRFRGHTIGPAGGQISAKGADGTVYSLDIPKNALAGVTKITMTPLSKVSGMPFDGKQAYAVQLEPEGLYLYYDAILTISRRNLFPWRSSYFSVTRPRARALAYPSRCAQALSPPRTIEGVNQPGDLKSAGWAYQHTAVTFSNFSDAPASRPLINTRSPFPRRYLLPVASNITIIFLP
jgi:hypothetical protein